MQSYLVRVLRHHKIKIEFNKKLVCVLGQTPLWLATVSNNARSVGLLVERGATVNSQVYETADGGGSNGQFCAAVHYAASHGQMYTDTLLQLLKSPSINLSVVDSQGLSCKGSALIQRRKLQSKPTFTDWLAVIRPYVAIVSK